MERIIAKILRINLREVKDLILSGDERIQQVISKLGTKLVIYDDNNLSMDDIDKRIASLNQKNTLGGPVDLVAVDYFTYIKGAGTYEGASVEALKMKGLAKKYNIIFFMLSQLNRSAGTYNEPTMDMLRMTGDLEASGDVIIMLSCLETNVAYFPQSSRIALLCGLWLVALGFLSITDNDSQKN